MHHLQDALLGIDQQRDVLATQLAREVIGLLIDLHTAIGADFAVQQVSMKRQQPAVGIDPLGQGGQGGQGRKSHPRGLIAAAPALMGTLLVGVLLIGLGHVLDFLSGGRPMHQQAFLLVAAMVALDRGVFLGLLWWAQVGCHTQTE